ncbi:hypothetical protein DWW32_00420 [Holdemanella biformis]|uniref:Uncharacterized protein n=1 Tax=Holdemanella biformis TaxID=1735 RepID=A0A395W9U7_9FIRM|nr:hypothetical protein [Holdemanella biformis]RGU94011.1 hypothetical protein DWW32_00420 [Holdemanella biformis]
MWIRTQNKYILANANSFRICKDSIDDWVYYAINGHYDRYEQELGIYSTKEKALKVLDEIQDAIEDTGFYRIDNIGHGTYAFSKGVLVYQMPQDEDVEV